MKIAIIDCFAGISGDMTLGALIDCGVPLKYLIEQLKLIDLPGYVLRVHKIKKHHISASKIEIDFDVKNQPERTYKNIVKMIECSKLSQDIILNSLRAFRILGEAEAQIHESQLENIHFHEIGAIDSIVDLMGSIIGFSYLGAEKIYTIPIPLGTGFTKTEHGVMPVPSPAALEILKDYPVVHRDSEYEMTTPTGATLVKTLSQGIIPENFVYVLERQGYGAGSIDSPKWPNLLRIIIGKSADNKYSSKAIIVETNIDDMNNEIFPYVFEKLYQAGAKDVFLTPLIMKKGRPGSKLSVITDEITLSTIETILFSETTTIGLRKYAVDRRILPREIVPINSRFGKIKVKTITLNGKRIIRPEYEQCKEIALKFNMSIMDVYHEIGNIKIENCET